MIMERTVVLWILLVIVYNCGYCEVTANTMLGLYVTVGTVVLIWARTVKLL